jgi:hypothetical protein
MSVNIDFTGTDAHIGHEATNNGDLYVDEVGAWDRALTESEIKYLYHEGSGTQDFISYDYTFNYDIDMQQNQIKNMGDLDMGNNNILNAEQMIMREVSINDDSYHTADIANDSGKLLVILDTNVVEVMFEMSGGQYAKVSELGSLFSTYTGVSNGTAGADASFNLFFDLNGGSPRIHLENRTGSTTNARYCVFS